MEGAGLVRAGLLSSCGFQASSSEQGPLAASAPAAPEAGLRPGWQSQVGSLSISQTTPDHDTRFPQIFAGVFHVTAGKGKRRGCLFSLLSHGSVAQNVVGGFPLRLPALV